MAEPRRYSLGTQQLDIEQILLEAQHRWLRPAEICEILQNYKKFRIAPEPANKPPSGSLFLFDRKVLRYFRKDGHNWRKKKDGKTVKEAHERLKAGSVDVLHCYYAHGEENENFQRRSYWLLEEERSNIVLVHYREVKGNRANFSRIKEAEETIHNSQESEEIVPNSEVDSSVSSTFNPYNYQVTSHATDTASLNSAQASEYEDAESGYNHQASSGFHSFLELQPHVVEKMEDGLSVPYYPVPFSNDYEGKLSAIPGMDFVPLVQGDKGKNSVNADLTFEPQKQLDFSSWKDVVGNSGTGIQSDTMSFNPGQGNELLEQILTNDFGKSEDAGIYSDSRGGGVLMDSTLQMMGVGLSSSSSSSSSSATTPEWKQILLGSGRSESSYHSSMLQEDMDCPQIKKEWRRSMNLKSFSDSTVNEFNQLNQGLNSATSSNNCTVTASFPMESASYGCPSKLLQTLYDTDSTPQRSLFDNRSINYLSNTNYQTNFNEISPSLANLSTLLRQQQPISPLNLTNSSQLWNSSYFPSTQAQFHASNFEEKPSFPNIIAMSNKELVQDSGSVVKKRSGEPPFKRPRIETPSPLPTFKVRKEKLGDRVTALQQLVSPFGKTNTASVLHEAIEYIKHLHNQVSVLSTPYMKNGPIHHQQTCEKVRDSEGPKQDLRARGLCLVPISSTFPVANDTTADFWTSTMFGRTFR